MDDHADRKIWESLDQRSCTGRIFASQSSVLHFRPVIHHDKRTDEQNYDIIAPQRGVRLLRLFSESPGGGLTAKEVAAISRLAVSTVHHFLANLVTTGFLNHEVEGTHHPSFSVGTTQTLAVYIAMILMHRVVMLSRTCAFARYPEAGRANCAFGIIQALIALLVLLSLVHPPRAFAANPDLDTVLTGSRQRIEKLDYRVTGRLTRVEADGKRTSYKFVAKAHWFPDGLRLLCVISGPGSEETRLLLHMNVSGHVTIEAELPGEKTAKVLPFERWNDPLMGTDFSYEDMVESPFFWKRQELLAPEKYGARDCFVLKSTAGLQDRSYYDSVTSWIDRSILFPVHVVKTLRGSGQQKDFVYYGLRQVDGAWSASQVEAKVQGKPGSSILVIERGSGKAHLGRKDFDLGQSSATGEKAK